jgi:hypothetical protein
MAIQYKKITALTAAGQVDLTDGDYLVFVDTEDKTESPEGTTKRIAVAEFLVESEKDVDGGVAGRDASGRVSGAGFVRESAGTLYQGSGSLTLAAAHNGRLVVWDSANPLAVTVPAGLGAGFSCRFIRLGAGTIAWTASSTTVSGDTTIERYKVAVLEAVGTNAFVLDCGGSAGVAAHASTHQAGGSDEIDLAVTTVYGAADAVLDTIVGNIPAGWAAAYAALPGNALTDVLRVEGDCREVGDSAFASCSALSSVVLPHVEVIGGSAFSGTVSIMGTPVVLPSATSIGEFAFLNSTVTAIYLNLALGAIVSDAFTSSNLTTVHLPQKDTPSGWTLGGGQSVAGKAGVTVAADWIGTDDTLCVGTAANTVMAGDDTRVIGGAPYTTGLTAVTGDISLDYANGAFQKVTLTGATAARVFNVPSNGAEGKRFEAWIHSTTGDARTLDFNASILKPSMSVAVWPMDLDQGKTYVVLLRHDGTAWMLISLIGGY